MFKNRDLSPDAKLRFPDYAGYSFGAGSNIMGAVISGFLLVYYSNVLFMELTAVGTIMGLSKIFDGVSDLFMGRIIDKTKSKYGMARPWYIRMIIPTIVSSLALFWVPGGINDAWRYVYIFITYNLVTTVCLTANGVAHSSMIGFMTLNTKSRGVVGVISMISNTIFTILVTNFFLKISRFFGSGDVYTQKGFTLTVLVYLGIYAVCAVMAFLLTRERINNTTSVVQEGCDAQAEPVNSADVPVWTAVKSLLQNKYWIICIIMCLGFYFLMTYSSSATIYFSQYILDDLDMQGKISSILYGVLLVGIVAALPVMNKFGKRNTMAIGLIVSAIGWFMPQFSLDKTYVIVAAAVIGVGFGFIAAPAGSFLQDTLTYGMWKSGVSAIGMGNAVFSFVNKLSSALGVVVLSFVLDVGNFDASLATQPASALNAIKLLYIWLPTIICVVCAIISIFYDLDKKLPAIDEDIKAGRIGDKRTQ